jgi:hypothetical protein
VERVGSGPLRVGGVVALAALIVSNTARATGETAQAAGGGSETRVASVAPAEPMPRPAPAAPEELVPRVLPTERVFYGWEVLAAGEIGGALVAGSIVLPSSEVASPVATFAFLIGMPIYALGGPLMHWRHGDFGKGMVSFSANVVGATVGGLIGGRVRCGKSPAPPNCGMDGFFDGLAVAVLTVPVLDAVILGWEDVPVDEPLPLTSRSAQPGAVALQPLVSVGPRSLSLGVGGRF